MLNIRSLLVACMTAVAIFTFTVSGQESTQVSTEVPDALRAKLTQSLEVASNSQLLIVNIKATELSNIFEVELNTGELLYSDVSGDYLFAGDMYQTTQEGLLNLSSATRQIRNLEKIAAVPVEEMIVFAPEEVKATINVFTDVDCTYCRALHRDVEDLMSRGLEIRYLAYPRGGEQAASLDKMKAVWCSDDPLKSLTQAKNGQNLPTRDCETPIMAHYELGNELGISGTPAIIFPDGRLVPGYLDADTLASMLQLN